MGAYLKKQHSKAGLFFFFLLLSSNPVCVSQAICSGWIDVAGLYLSHAVQKAFIWRNDKSFSAQNKQVIDWKTLMIRWKKVRVKSAHAIGNDKKPNHSSVLRTFLFRVLKVGWETQLREREREREGKKEREREIERERYLVTWFSRRGVTHVECLEQEQPVEAHPSPGQVWIQFSFTSTS